MNNIVLTDEEKRIIEVYRIISNQGKKYLQEQTEIALEYFNKGVIHFPWWKTEQNEEQEE